MELTGYLFSPSFHPIISFGYELSMKKTVKEMNLKREREGMSTEIHAQSFPLPHDNLYKIICNEAIFNAGLETEPW